MKNILSKFLLSLSLVFLSSFSFSFLSYVPVSAARCEYFLGMPSWDCNTNFDVGRMPDSEALKTDIWVAVANVFTSITVIAAYLAIGFVIYGGYLYIFSSGDSGKVATGRQTLTRAFIGLAIVMLAHVILSSIRVALGFNLSDDCTYDRGENVGCINPGDMFMRAVTWVISIAGVVSVIFIVYGGVAFMTSSGEPQKVTKAKNTILYALIGLAIVALSMTITAFVSHIIQEGAFSPPASVIANTSITKKGLL